MHSRCSVNGIIDNDTALAFLSLGERDGVEKRLNTCHEISARILTLHRKTLQEINETYLGTGKIGS